MNIAYLAGHTEVIPMLAQWFYKEWAYLHPEKTLADVPDKPKSAIFDPG
jgi:hypothetical protein